MAIETVMARIQEIRSTVGLVEQTNVSQVEPQPTSSTGVDLAEQFSTQLASAVDSGNTTAVSALLQGLTSSTGSQGSSAATNALAGLAGSQVEATDRVQGSRSTSAAEPTPATEPNRATGSTPSGDRVVAEAKKYLGVPYVWGGTNPNRGLDCSGLVQLVFKNLGVEMPRVARQQAKVGTVIPSLSQAQPGDIIGMRNGKHIAIYLGNNKILHAPQPGEKVSIRALNSRDDIDVIRRVIEDPVTASPASSTRTAEVSQASRTVDMFTRERVSA